MEGSARVGVINEPDVQLLAASEDFFGVLFFLFKQRDQRLARCGRIPGDCSVGWFMPEQGGAGQWKPSEM